MMEVLAPGLLTTVQDLGRTGLRHLGVPSCGAADRDALRIGNRLVGNAESEAGLECTLVGPTLRFRQPHVIALTGGRCDASCDGMPLPMWRPVAVAAGAELTIARVRQGARAYLAIEGGIDVPEVLGSRSTDLRAGFGGHEGRALRARDRIATIAPASSAFVSLFRRLEQHRSLCAGAPWWIAPTEDLRGDVLLLHLLPGPDLAALDPRVLRALRDGVWTVSSESDRMGVRVDGPLLRSVSIPERISSAVLPGAVQLPPDGRPILLGVDAQTVGGYPVVGQVIRADLGLAMQLRPGDKVRPVVVTAEAAQAAWRSRRIDLARMGEAIRARLVA